MEANEGFKQRLENAWKSSEKIKIIFQYPSSNRAIIRRGIVINIFNDSFDFNDRYEGTMTFSYKFICEISNWRDE